MYTGNGAAGLERRLLGSSGSGSTVMKRHVFAAGDFSATGMRT